VGHGYDPSQHTGDCHDTFVERLPQDLDDTAATLGPFIQAAHALVGQRHLARPRHVAPADQPHIGDGVMGETGGS
jgi:hypothetical protein